MPRTTKRVPAPLVALPLAAALAGTQGGIRDGAGALVDPVSLAGAVLDAVLILAPATSSLPMAALAALLVLVAWNMSEAGHFVHMVRVAPKSGLAVLLTCYA